MPVNNGVVSDVARIPLRHAAAGSNLMRAHNLRHQGSNRLGGAARGQFSWCFDLEGGAAVEIGEKHVLRISKRCLWWESCSW